MIKCCSTPTLIGSLLQNPLEGRLFGECSPSYTGSVRRRGEIKIKKRAALVTYLHSKGLYEASEKVNSTFISFLILYFQSKRTYI